MVGVGERGEVGDFWEGNGVGAEWVGDVGVGWRALQKSRAEGKEMVGLRAFRRVSFPGSERAEMGV